MEAYCKVQIEFSATGEPTNKKWLNSRSMVASSHKAPSRNLLLLSHPPKEQPAQLICLLLVKPISKLLPGWTRKELGRKGDSCRHSSSPATSGCRGTLSSPTQTFWEGCGWSPHTCTVAVSAKQARGGLHNHLSSLFKYPHRPNFGHEAEEGQMSAVQPIPGGRRYSFPSNAAHTQTRAWVTHCRHVTLLQHQMGAALTPTPCNGKKRVGFVFAEGACQA